MRLPALLVLAFGSILFSSVPAVSQVHDKAKDPAVALGFAWLCPGCGHLYTGETAKGALIGAISVGALATGTVIQLTRGFDTECRRTVDPFACHDASLDLTPILVGGAIGLAGYLYGLIDAGASARRMNVRSGFEFGQVDVKPTIVADGSVRTQFTIRLR